MDNYIDTPQGMMTTIIGKVNVFGTEEHYVLPVQELRDPDELADGFDWLLANEDSIRSHLKCVMPEYIQRAYTAAEAVSRLK